MSEIQVAEYRRIKTKKTMKKEKKSEVLLDGAVGFLFSLAVICGNIAPLGLSYLTKERAFEKRTFFVALSVMLGTVILGGFPNGIKYAAAEALYAAVLFVLERGIRLSYKAATFFAVLALTLSGALVLYWQGVTTGGVLSLLGEILVVIFGTAIADKIRNIDLKKLICAKSLSPDKRLSVVITVGVMLMGTKNLFPNLEISVANSAAALLVLIASSGSGAAVGAVFGMWIGFASGIGGDFFMPMVGTFGFCGFLCGLFSKFGKGGAAVGLILANAVLIVYTNNAIEPMIKIYEIFLGVAAFIFVPERVISSAGEILKINGGERETVAEIKEGIKARLKKISSSFKEMADTMEKLSEVREESSGEIAELFDRAADKICVNCRKSPVCWGKNFNATYRALFSVLENFEKNGKIEETDFGDYINSNCLNKEKLMAEILAQTELYKTELVWRGRMAENRSLACRQISGISEAIENVAEDIDEKGRDENISPENIKSMFKDNGVKIKEVSVSEDKNGRKEAVVLMKNSATEKLSKEKAGRMFKKLTGRNFALDGIKKAGKGYSALLFGEKKMYEVSVGCAAASSSEANGDSYMFFELECGKFVIILSDGMGTGKKAARESRAITELLNSFMNSGINKNLALKLINTVMIMKSEREDFATIDICVIDLFTGEAEFIKSGAEPSYILIGDRVETVTGRALPLGILPENEPESFKRYLKDGDFIVMATDGIASKETGGEWLREYMEIKKNMSPKETADEILNIARKNAASETFDDMTVISVKISKIADKKAS